MAKKKIKEVQLEPLNFKEPGANTRNILLRAFIAAQRHEIESYKEQNKELKRRNKMLRELLDAELNNPFQKHNVREAFKNLTSHQP